jgi:PTH1 family peptidyl-tRNA hydrolase
VTADGRINRGVTVVKIICGLGNHGSHYEHTRHNLGFDVIDRLVRQLDISGDGQASWFSFRVVSRDGGVYLIKPATYVNRSGAAISEAMTMFDADPTELFVISDDFHLPLGALRIRKTGSSGGHNGLESIIEELGRIDFPRLRIGIGPLPAEAIADREKTSEFVLSRFEPHEMDIVEQMKSQAVEAVKLALNKGLDPAISTYNRVNPTPEK